MSGALVLSHGARRCEAELVAEVLVAHASDVGDVSALARPVRVVVPSRSLRRHLVAALLRARKASLAGVSIETLNALALGVLERCGEAAPPDDALFGVRVRQLAREVPALHDRLEPLDDGYGVVEASVSDLLDAGFEAAHAEGLVELLSELGSGAATARAAAVVAVAAGVASEIEDGRLGHRSALLRRAREWLRDDPTRALPARAVFVHGFADATGVQTDLLETLVQRHGAQVHLDAPPDPVTPEAGPRAGGFGARFAARLDAAAGSRRELPGSDAAPVRVLHAPGSEAEARALAEALRARLDAGAVAERLAVVARDLPRHRLALRRHLGRLAVPFSGCGARGPRDAAGRRLAALLVLLRERERAPAERWLEALGDLRAFGHARDRPLSARERADLRLALHARGAARLREVAEDAETRAAGDVALPVRSRLDCASDGRPRARRRHLPGALLAAAQGAARALAARLASAGRDVGGAPLGERLAWLRELVESDLGWRDGLPGHGALHAWLEEAESLSGDFPLALGDFVSLVERGLRAAGRDPIGGRGGGVQVLDVLEARAHTFDALFAIGLERDVFPRVVREDPLVPDDLRRRLRALLPDLPVKREGVDEERHLFAQLLSCAGEVVLSCAISDDDGRPRSPSPLLDALRLAERADEPRLVPGPRTAAWLARSAGAAAALRPASEWAELCGLHGSRDQFGALLPVALGEVRREPPERAAALARVRAAVLAELDPRAGRRGWLGPYYGFVGAAREPADPRRAPLWVTAAERTADCPWQHFLTRLLRVEPIPDALATLPGFDKRLLGSLVHRALDAIVDEAVGDGDGTGSGPRDLESALGREPRGVPWPDAARLDALLSRLASELLRDEGIDLPGFAGVLARHARLRVEHARALDWPEPGGPVGALGAELEGEARVVAADGRERRLRFRADRVDRVVPGGAGEGAAAAGSREASGGLRLVDYKTGRSFVDARRADKRRDRHLRGVDSGRRLQAAAYARAAAATDAGPAEGRYLFIDPDTPEDARLAVLAGDDEEFARHFAAAVDVLAEVIERGSFFPRLEDVKSGAEPWRCTRCEVKAACLRGDTGARARLVAWVERGDDQTTPAERALRAAWPLGRE